jgi:adenylate kinase family enzyme
MKNILIWGPARAGKTTLARKLRDKFGHSIVCTDILITTFEQSFPQLGIRHNSMEVSANFAPFTANYLRHLALNEDKFVAALTHFHVDMVFEMLGEMKSNFTLIGLTYSKKPWQNLRRDVKKYDTKNDWTYRLTNDELDNFCKESVEHHSKFFEEKFAEYGFATHDVSFERDRVLDEIVNQMLQALSYASPHKSRK